MTPGQQATQASHAAINFTFEHPSRASPWFRESNTLVLLSAANESELIRLRNLCLAKGLAVTAFIEPDLNDSITALCIEPSPETKKLTSHLPLLLKHYNHEQRTEHVSY